MSDYRLWCRLCGSLEGTSEIEVDLLQIIEQIFEVNNVNFSALIELFT